jgi:RNA polymerase sigma-70 factor (ECF subfamily)
MKALEFALLQMKFDSDTINRYRCKVRYKVCYHLGSFCQDVEDVVQETLTRFLRAIQDNKIRNPESVGAFLSGICNNVILEYRRRLWKEPPTDLDWEASQGTVAPEVELLDLREEIDAAMEQLPKRDREMLQAFFLQERTKDEVCGLMGLSDVQFRVALFRAKDRFRKIYRRKL